MKYLAIIAAFVLGIFAVHCYHTKKAVAAAAIPNTIEGFYAAVTSGDITFKLASDPFGIYDRSGQKIGYYTTDGSVYSMANVLVAKGFGGVKTK